ncbi:MAG: hypothetical protein FJ060_11255 [Cyanobacteria bacterium K_Offshore_0m_m2_072]|nr:hypothetical protein [Cyanobacteria bacterium K_Offshore_0m_m2_072]
MAPLLTAFALTWLLALLWLLLITRLLGQLARHDPQAYDRLGSPVLRWLWWSWPDQRQGLPPFLSLTALAQRRLELQTLYTPNEIGSMLRLVRWILFNRPRLSVTPPARRLQGQLRLCAIGFGLGLAAVVLVGVLG